MEAGKRYRKRETTPVAKHYGFPEGPARQIDVSRQKLSPHCLEAIFDSQLPSPKLSPKMPPKLSLPTREGFLSSFKINPAVRVIARQVRDKNCLAAIFAPRHQSVSSGPLGSSAVLFLVRKGPLGIAWSVNLGNVASATTTAESLIWWIIRCYI